MFCNQQRQPVDPNLPWCEILLAHSFPLDGLLGGKKHECGDDICALNSAEAEEKKWRENDNDNV